MEKHKESGIVIDQIRLLRSHIEFVNMDGVREYNLRLVSLNRVDSPDGKAMDLFAGFDVSHPGEAGFERIDARGLPLPGKAAPGDWRPAFPGSPDEWR